MSDGFFSDEEYKDIEYTTDVPTEVERIKLPAKAACIFEYLVNTGTSWPRPAAHVNDIRALCDPSVGQQEFSRRIRELRDYGFEVENTGKQMYSLVSPRRKHSGSPFSSTQKKYLKKQGRYECFWCKAKGRETQKCQCDHRVPICRGGTNNFDNGQLLCKRHNAIKREICEGCTKDCLNCPLAFPEKFPNVLTAILEI